VAFPLRRLSIGAALALAAAIVAYRGIHREPPAPLALTGLAGAASALPRPPLAGAAELSLVAPLVPGSKLGGFVIREIRGVERGRERVVCAHDDAVVRLDVMLADPEGTLPPATAGRYAVFYSLRGATPEDGERLARKLAAVITANAAAPEPPGMTTFTPNTKPAMTL
jgi:hypothetical protein